MADISTYVRFLPPVLWEKEPPLPAFSLGAMLRVFEKILTGIDDGIPIGDGTTSYEPIEAIIARVPRLFDPWSTPAEFLPWLASWLALEVSPLWDDYQTRKAIAGIVQLYRKRGLKAGMIGYLDLYTVAATRPRIAIDNGSKLLFSQPQRGQATPIYTLVSQGPFIRANGSVAFAGLFKPWCIALAPDGSLFVGDFGAPGNAPFSIESRVWHLSPTGQYDFSGQPPQPASIGPAFAVVAIAVRNASPWELYVLDYDTTELYQLLGPTFGTATRLTTVGDSPVAMAIDTNGDILVLDRGTVFPAPAIPTVIRVTTTSLTVTPHALTQVIEPLSLLVLPDGDLIIGDGGVQQPVAACDYPGNLVRVNRTDPVNWLETVLLPVPPTGVNPLVAPTAVVSEDATHLLVLDVGLKPFVPDPATPFTSDVAEPAAVYRVDLGASPPTVAFASETGDLVYPTGMVFSNGTLYICDPGEPEIAGIQPPLSRVLPYEFFRHPPFLQAATPVPAGPRKDRRRDRRHPRPAKRGSDSLEYRHGDLTLLVPKSHVSQAPRTGDILMNNLVLTRIYYIDPQIPSSTPRGGNTAHGESAVDAEQYYVLTGQVHGLGLHEWGVATGLAVSATLNNPAVTGVTVGPGVGLDVNGRQISLAYLPNILETGQGRAEINPQAANPLSIAPTSDLQTMTASGVTLPTTGFTGDYYITIEWRETFDQKTWNASNKMTYQLLHTPWLRLMPVTLYVDDGNRLVLAQVTIDSVNGITSLTPGLRRHVSLPAQSLHLRYAQQVSPTSIDNLPTGEISAHPTGGIQLKVQNQMDSIYFVRSDGSKSIQIFPEGGALAVGAPDVPGEISIFDSTEVSVLLSGQGASISLGRADNFGEVFVYDNKGQLVVDVDGYQASITVGGTNHPGVIRVIDGSGTTVRLEAATGVAQLKRLAAIDTGSKAIDVDATHFHIHGTDLTLDGSSLGNKQALVDGNNKLIVNCNGDYGLGVEVQSDLAIGPTVRLEAATGVAQLKRLAAIDTGSNTIDVDTHFFRIHGYDLCLDGRSGGNKRALVDWNDATHTGGTLIVNCNGDYGQGVEVHSDLAIVRTVGPPVGPTVRLEAATGVARLKRLAAIDTGSNTIDVDTHFFRIHGYDLCLDGRSGGNKRALVDWNDATHTDGMLIVNCNGDYGHGVEVHSDLAIVRTVGPTAGPTVRLEAATGNLKIKGILSDLNGVPLITC